MPLDATYSLLVPGEGDQEWRSIEKYSYKKLIDTMLRDVQEDDEEEDQVKLLRAVGARQISALKPTDSMDFT